MGNFTSPKDEKFFGAIGRLAISWGHLELGLDCMVEILYHGFGGDKIEAEIPRALQRKITFLRATFKTMQIGPEAIQGFLTLLDQIQDAAQTRHDIIHGVVVEQVELSGEATMIRAVRNKNGVVKRKFVVTTKSILEAAREAQKLGGIVLNAVNKIYDLIDKLSAQRATH